MANTENQIENESESYTGSFSFKNYWNQASGAVKNECKTCPRNVLFMVPTSVYIGLFVCVLSYLIMEPLLKKIFYPSDESRRPIHGRRQPVRILTPSISFSSISSNSLSSYSSLSTDSSYSDSPSPSRNQRTTHYHVPYRSAGANYSRPSHGSNQPRRQGACLRCGGYRQPYPCYSCMGPGGSICCENHTLPCHRCSEYLGTHAKPYCVNQVGSRRDYYRR